MVGTLLAFDIHINVVLDNAKEIFEGENRRFLRSKKGKIYGLNIWDENFQYINYRYCICGKEDFISEYMRLLFYTDSVILNKGKLVNDGGVLDNPKLRFFKDKLNPMQVKERRTWRKKENQYR